MANAREICCVCLIDDWDKCNVLYGDWITKDTLSVHYFCLLSSFDIPQRGKIGKGKQKLQCLFYSFISGSDKEGIHGFLLSDILLTFNKYRNIKCYLCAKDSAAVNYSHQISLLQ